MIAPWFIDVHEGGIATALRPAVQPERRLQRRRSYSIPQRTVAVVFFRIRPDYIRPPHLSADSVSELFSRTFRRRSTAVILIARAVAFNYNERLLRRRRLFRVARRRLLLLPLAYPVGQAEQGAVRIAVRNRGSGTGKGARRGGPRGWCRGGPRGRCRVDAAEYALQ
jgi:hypothetical protein